MNVSDCNNIYIRENVIEDINNNGMNLRRNQRITVENNDLNRIALEPGRGYNQNGQYIGIYYELCSGITVSKNVIDSIGYNGISMYSSSNASVKNNVVTYSCLTKDDGGGIYTWGNNEYEENEIVGNIVLHTIGAPQGTNHPDQPEGQVQLNSYSTSRFRNFIVVISELINIETANI